MERRAANYQGTEMRLRKSACIVYRNIKYKALLDFMNLLLSVYFNFWTDNWEI